MATIDNRSTVKVAIIILTVNQRDKTVRCLTSLRTVEIPELHIVLWDNGSGDGTSEVVRQEFPEVIVHYYSGNLGVASGRNAAAQLALRTLNPSHLMFLDNDIVVTPGFVEALLQPFKHDNKLAQTVPKIMVLGDPQCLDSGGGVKIQFWLGRTKRIGRGEVDHGQYDQTTQCIAGGCTLVRTDVFQEVGGFDPQFNPYGPEDVDFSLRIYKRGYYALYVPWSLIFHDQSLLKEEKYTEMYARNKSRHWFLFMRRHAVLGEQISFILLGAPYVLVRAIIREGKKGNLRAVRGLFSGLVDRWRSPIRDGKFQDIVRGNLLIDHNDEEPKSCGDGLLESRKEGI